MTATPDTPSTARPDTLKRPIRKAVKKWGKKFTRWIARHQTQVSLVPNTPFLDPALFPFLKEFEDRWEDIAAETHEVMKFRDTIPAFQEISPDQYRIATEKNWRTFILFGFGERLETNCAQMPVTTEILERVPNLRIAWLSILAPGYHIPAHTGVTKGLIRSHLGLILPKDREQCRIRVGDEIRPWSEGKFLILDDTYEHEVWNETDEERVILLFDFDRPMKWSGRMLNRFLLWAIKFTAFYRDPLHNSRDAEKRFEAAIRQADATMEDMSDPS